MKTYKETRILDATKLRSLCIKHDWYTAGTIEEYTNLFDRLYDELGCPVDMTTEKLVEVAEDIMRHSHITEYTITAVMYELADSCYSYFEEV